MKLKRWISTFAMVAGLMPAAWATTNYPDRAITLVIPYAPGGPTDVLGRLVAEELGKRLGNSLVVENQPGAAGSVGMTRVARATPDGYTLLFGDINLAVGNLVVPSMAIDVGKDLAPVGFVGTAPMLLLARASFPANNAGELIQALRAAPGKFAYASGGHGSPTHLGMELLKNRQGLDVLMVTYRGSGPALTALAGGEVDVMLTGMSAARPFIEGKRIKALGILGHERSPAMPDLPTLKEQGYDLPEMAMGSWWGVMAPTGTPADIVARLNTELETMLNDPAVQARLSRLNISAHTSTPEWFSEFIESQRKVWSELVKPAEQ